MGFINNVRCRSCNQIRYQPSGLGRVAQCAQGLNIYRPVCPSCGARGCFYDSAERWAWSGKWYNPLSWMRGDWVRANSGILSKGDGQ